jgi:hypothetical protein
VELQRTTFAGRGGDVAVTTYDVREVEDDTIRERVAADPEGIGDQVGSVVAGRLGPTQRLACCDQDSEDEDAGDHDDTPGDVSSSRR